MCVCQHLIAGYLCASNIPAASNETPHCLHDVSLGFDLLGYTDLFFQIVSAYCAKDLQH